MSREAQVSSPNGEKYSRYKSLSERELKRLFPVDDTPKPYDQYENLRRIAKQFFKTVEPTIKDTQKKINSYNPKQYGEKRTYPQDWSANKQAKAVRRCP